MLCPEQRTVRGELGHQHVLRPGRCGVSLGSSSGRDGDGAAEVTGNVGIARHIGDHIHDMAGLGAIEFVQPMRLAIHKRRGEGRKEQDKPLDPIMATTGHAPTDHRDKIR